MKAERSFPTGWRPSGSRSGTLVESCAREASRPRPQQRLRGTQGLPTGHGRVRLRADCTQTELPVRPRFLVADEVGLGKTLVARGLIAKTIEHLAARRSEDRRRLRLLELGDRPPEHPAAERHGQGRLRAGLADHAASARAPPADANRLNFVSFTPGTSLDLKSTGGIARERALLYRLLARQLGRAPFCAAWVRVESSKGTVSSDANFRWHISDVGRSSARREARAKRSRGQSSGTTEPRGNAESRVSASSSMTSAIAFAANERTGQRSISTTGGGSSALCAISLRASASARSSRT